VPTVKYVGKGMEILPARRSATVSSSSAKRLPVTSAIEKFCFACRVDSFVKRAGNWPLTLPTTILFVIS